MAVTIGENMGKKYQVTLNLFSYYPDKDCWSGYILVL